MGMPFAVKQREDVQSLGQIASRSRTSTKHSSINAPDSNDAAAVASGNQIRASTSNSRPHSGKHKDRHIENVAVKTKSDSSGDGHISVASEIAKLGELWKQGLLNEQEFIEAKQQVIRGLARK
jgi:hypothetical protein